MSDTKSIPVRGIPGEHDAVWIQVTRDPAGVNWTVNGEPTAEEQRRIDEIADALDAPAVCRRCGRAERHAVHVVPNLGQAGHRFSPPV